MTIDTQAIRERAERLIELASKATPGKWYREPGIAYSVEIETVDKKPIAIADIGRDDCESNAAHIVANDPPTVIATNRDLLSALDREKVLEAEVERLKAEQEQSCKLWHDELLKVAAREHLLEPLEARLATLRQQVEAKTDSLKAINRLTSAGDRTLDQMIRDMGLACDIARAAALSPHTAKEDER